jgi:tRNA dimethylallyltransferase
MNKKKNNVIFIVGATASGKSRLAMELARVVDADIVSADSRQIYRGMDIGTAKPRAEELAEIKHWFIDELDPDENFSAGLFSRQARERIRLLEKQNRNIIVAGGSGLYVKALIDGFLADDIRDEKVRNALQTRLQEEGIDSLYENLKELDPESATKIGSTDTQRILRYLEVVLATGKTLPFWQQKSRSNANFTFRIFALSVPRHLLYEAINKRVDQMIDDGLLVEVAGLRAAGLSENSNAFKTVGYKELYDYLNGQTNFTETVTKIKQNTRNYAKRQLTWFRADSRIAWMDYFHAQDKQKTFASILKEFS